MAGGRKKGTPKTGGRKKGTPNKITSSVRQMFKECFEEMGGVETMLNWAMKNKTVFYKLYARLLPIEVKTDMNHTLTQQQGPSVRIIIPHNNRDPIPPGAAIDSPRVVANAANAAQSDPQRLPGPDDGGQNAPEV
jgi:hypothetical protein